MTITLNGTTGINTPGVVNTAAQTVATTLTVTGAATLSSTLAVTGVTTLGAMGSSIITSGTAVASTSGTSIDFTSIPSWVKRVTVMFNGVSVSGTSAIQIQIGDSGGIETTAYQSGVGSIATSTAATASSTAGYLIGGASAANQAIGHYIFTNVSGNIWVGSGVIYLNNSQIHYVAGLKELSATLDRVRVTTAGGTDTFDAGSINILYE